MPTSWIRERFGSVKSSAIFPRELPGILPCNVVHPCLSPTGSVDGTSRAGDAVRVLQREVILLSLGARRFCFSSRILSSHAVLPTIAPFNTERWGHAQRLHQTLRAMLRLTFCANAEALAAAHGSTRFTTASRGLSQATEHLPKGTLYSAHDPALLAWVHATLLEMVTRLRALCSIAVCGGKGSLLHGGQLDRGLLGIPKGRVPRSLSGFSSIWRQCMSGEICVTDVARTLAGASLSAGAPHLLPAISFMRLTTIGSLPTSIRADWLHGCSARYPLRLLIALTRIVLPLTPPILRYWPAAYVASGSGCPFRMHPRGGSARADRPCHLQAR